MASRMIRALLLAAVCCALPGLCAAQNVNVQDAQSAHDYRKRGGAHVDPVTLGMQLQIPLGDYPGRAGMGLPITLYYSSKLWRIEHQDTTSLGGASAGEYDSRFRAMTPKESAMGWTSSLDWFLWPSDRTPGPEKYDIHGKLVPGAQYARTVARMYVTLPGGSKHELRRDDTVLAAGSDYTTGTFHSVDGSRLRYESASRTLFTPDGTRIVSEVDAGGAPVARHVIDRNGNRNTYSYATGAWTDTLGRTYAPPPLRTTAGEYEYLLPGVGGNLRYVFRWKNLSAPDVREPDTSGAVPALRYRGDKSMSYPHTTVSPSLFTTHDVQNSVVSTGSLFDPVVLSEIELPNGKKYTFRYNVWGEVVRVTYPAGAYELFTYGEVTPVSGQVEAPLYAQANRGVTKRTLVVPGAENGTSVWTYGTTIDSSVTPLRLMRRVTAPDGSYTETLYHHSRGAAIKFGFDDARGGKPFDERAHSASGRMLRRTLTKWEYTGPVPYDQNSTATRHARATKVVEILLDTDGDALATTTERLYDSDLNITSTSRHAFVSLARATAESAAVDSITKGALLRTEETDYLTSDPAYRARNLLSLPTETRVKDAAGAVVARSQMFYDETALAQYGAVTGWDAPGVSARGNLTRTRSRVDTTNTWVETRAEYDQCGSPVKTVDALLNETLLGYSPLYAYAYPTSVTTAAPNPAAVPNPPGASFGAGTFGSTTGFTSSMAYDHETGLVTSTTDANDKITTFDYTDPLDRLKRVERPDGGRTTYVYADTHPCGALVETHTLLDASGREVSSWQFFDGLGRPYLSESWDGQDAANQYFRVDTRYDSMGRVSKVSNPYRTLGCGTTPNPSGLWTTTEYDALGRVTKVTTPDGARVSTEYAGAHARVTDQDDRQRVSETDALGRLIEVWEVKADDQQAPDPWLETFTFPAQAPPGVPSVATGYKTSYAYDVLGNLRAVTQGQQPARVFTYDSLSRLTSASNPESGTVNYAYDANGNLTGKTDARGVTTTYVYDRLNRNVITRYAGGGTTTPEVRRFYDNAAGGRGRLRRSEAVGVAATEVISFDAAGRPTEQRQSYWANNAWGQEYSVRRSYDRAGNVTSQTYPSGHVVAYSYDAAGRLGDNGSQLAFTGNLGDGVQRTYASTVSYDEFGGLREERFGTQTPLYHKQHYNVRGQLFDVRLSTVPWATDQWEWNRGAVVNYYSPDCQWKASGVRNNGNLRCSEHAVPLDPNAGYTPGAAGAFATSYQTYGYDALNRLTGVTEKSYVTGGSLTPAFTQAFKYDRWGNRTVDADATQDYGQNPVYSIPEPRFGVDAQTNRLGVPVGQPGQMTYDPAGNLVHDSYTGGGGRVYDAENRMTAAVDRAGVWAYYTYDADGRRVKRKIADEEWWQVYGMEGELLGEYRAGAAVYLPSKEYGYRGGELLVTMSSGDDLRLARFVSNLYYGALRVEPQPADLRARVNQLAAAGAQGEAQLLLKAKEIARGLFVQTAYETSPYRSDSQYVTDLYYAYLQRAPDTQGLNWWTGQMANGRENVCNAFEGSSEFEALVSTLYGDAASDGERRDRIIHVSHLGAYGRIANSSELDSWRGQLDAASALGPDEVKAKAELLGRGLFAAQVSDLSLPAGQFVANLYESFLQRGPDAEGLSFWTSQINNTTQSRQHVLDAFATCPPARELAGTLYRETFWLVSDHLGTPRMVADRTGSLAGVKRHDYLPFGEELSAGAGGRADGQGYGAVDNVRQKFTSYERDAETKLDYAQFRYFSSPQGRFTSTDPLLESAQEERPQTWNRYAYVLNNPLKFVDPNGLRYVQRTLAGGTIQYGWCDTDECYNNAIDSESEDYQGWTAVTFDESKPYSFFAPGITGERYSSYTLNPDGTHGYWQVSTYGKGGVGTDWNAQLAVGGLLRGLMGAVGGLIDAIAGGTAGATTQAATQAAAQATTQAAQQATVHGGGRLAQRGFSAADIALTKTGHQFLQRDGATVFIKEVAPGKFNVWVEGQRGVVTAMKNVAEKKVAKLAKNYGWYSPLK